MRRSLSAWLTAKRPETAVFSGNTLPQTGRLIAVYPLIALNLLIISGTTTCRSATIP